MHKISNKRNNYPGSITLSTTFRQLLLIFCVLAAPKLIQASALVDTPKSVSVTQVKDSIVSIQNLGSQHDSTKIKEVIAIKLVTTKNIDSLNTLYVDGIAVTGLKPWKTNNAEKILYFRLDDKVQDILLKFLESSPFEKSIVSVHFGVGNTRYYVSNKNLPIYVEVRQKISHFWIWLAAVALFVLALISVKFNILKDDNNLYYSLGRTQLFYWTLLVLIAYLSICFKTDTLPDLPLSVLAILGISVSTTAISKLVENKNKDIVPIDKNAKSEGFFFDILSDGSSINIQRFQNVAFNLFFGIVFLQKAFANHIMPEFDQNVLILMGISSGTYAALKNTEATKEQTEPLPPTGGDPPSPPNPPAPPADPKTATDTTPKTDVQQS